MSLKIKGSFETEIYVSKSGYVALKQNGDYFGRADVHVLLAPHQLPEAITKLQSLWENRASWEISTEDDDAGVQSDTKQLGAG